MLQATEPHRSWLDCHLSLTSAFNLPPAVLFVTHEDSTAYALWHEESSTLYLCDSAVGALVVHRPVRVSLLVSILTKYTYHWWVFLPRTLPLLGKVRSPFCKWSNKQPLSYGFIIWYWVFYDITWTWWITSNRAGQFSQGTTYVCYRKGREEMKHELLFSVRISLCSESFSCLATLLYL